MDVQRHRAASGHQLRGQRKWLTSADMQVSIRHTKSGKEGTEWGDLGTCGDLALM